jgi:colanic acid/amylovoran biosynthesis glycosyltransferase
LFLVLFTTSYPFDFTAEYAFINPEIRRLAGIFEKIILIPRIAKGKILPLPANAEVNDGYADFLQRNSSSPKIIQMARSSRGVAGELRRHPAILWYPSKMLKLILFSARVELTKRWLTNLIETQHLDMNQGILYSYWLDHTATGLAMIKREYPAAKFVSRAHGFDIYEEYYYPYYWPYRRETLDALDTLFVASDAGRNYFCEHYPDYQSKFETAHLGIEDPSFITSPSPDLAFRIVSCSYIVPVKRLNLLVAGIVAAARLRPEQKFEWTHFGDGSAKKSLLKKMTQEFSSNVQGHFRGHVPNAEVIQYYRDHPVDVFVNVSKTEGGAPVSIQEAISCGIPVIATSVGGNPEIVSEENGILLAPDPLPDEIAAALLKLRDDARLAARLRAGSRRVWQTSYNAEVNFRLFAERLRSIGER